MHVKMILRGVSLEGALELPARAKAIVVFAHGSGSSRLSPRNRYVAGVLREAGFGTFLFDLLTASEDMIFANRFDIGTLSSRLVEATGWLLERAETKDLSLGYFGASTGAAAALRASTEWPSVHAVVSRGGRPDMAEKYLQSVTAPTLLIVGGNDEEVLELNREAFKRLTGVRDKELAVVKGATHLFEEPGALEEVARLASDWFGRFLT